jgi:hypothetical protein
MDPYNVAVKYLCEKFGIRCKQLTCAGSEEIRKARNVAEAEKIRNDESNYHWTYNIPEPEHEDYNIHLLVTQYSYARCVRFELQTALEQIGIESEC